MDEIMKKITDKKEQPILFRKIRWKAQNNGQRSLKNDQSLYHTIANDTTVNIKSQLTIMHETGSV